MKTKRVTNRKTATKISNTRNTRNARNAIKGGSKMYGTNGIIKNLSEKYDGQNFFRKIGVSTVEHRIGQILQENPHPNIVKIYRITEKYMDIEIVKPITEEWTYDEAALLKAMTNAKDHLQKLGIMYIDWKPDNAGLGNDGQYKLYDFDVSGITKNAGKKWNLAPSEYWSYRQAIANGKKTPKNIDDFSFNIGLVRKNYVPI